MSDEPTFDPRRKAAIRELVVDNAAAHPGRAGGRKRTALVAILVVLALTISGGSVAYALGTGLIHLTPAAAPSPTPTVTPTPTLTPTPTSTPTPAVPVQDPADPSSWVIGFDGVGPVAIGAEMSTIPPLLPGWTDETDALCVPGQLDLMAPDGLTMDTFIFESSGDRVANIHLSWNRTVADGRPVVSPKTDRGIGIGSTREELLAAYPEIPVTGRYSDIVDFYGLNNGSGTWIAFAVQDDVIDRITVGPSSGMPSEYCPA